MLDKRFRRIYIMVMENRGCPCLICGNLKKEINMEKTKKVELPENAQEGEYPESNWVRCTTRLSKAVAELHPQQKTVFYLPFSVDDEALKVRYDIGLNAIIRRGIQGISHSIDSDSIFANPLSWNGDNLTPEAIKKIQHAADNLTVKGRTGAPKKKEADIRMDERLQLAQSAGCATVEEFHAALAAMKKKRK